MHKLLSAVAVAVFLAFNPMLRADKYVNGATGDDTGPGTELEPYKTISNGVFKAGAGEVVYVAGGTYVLSTNILITNAITLRGENRTNTILQGQFPAITNRGIYINHADATVEEFTITGFGMTQNTPAGSGAGGGVYLENGTLRACIITNNVGADKGGGVYQAAGLVSNCVISFNTNINYTWSGGGGVHMRGQVWNCYISDNAATRGGGVAMYAGALLVKSVVSNNVSYYCGGGIFTDASVISNCTVVNNSIPVNNEGGGIFCQNNSAIHSSIIRNNHTRQLAGGICCYMPGTQYIGHCEISGNQAPENYGGGILLVGGGLALENCVISNNFATRSGGGIEAGVYANDGVKAIGCRIVGNVISDGHGAGVSLCSNSVLENCVIRDNIITNLTTAYRFGAGIFCRVGGNSIIRNCLIAGNIGDDTKNATGGGGIYIASGSANQIDACTIADNYAMTGGGVYLDGAGADSFSNCIVISNRVRYSCPDIYLDAAARGNVFTYSCSATLTNTTLGNITNTPLFADQAAGDYRLTCLSPGINVGANQPWMADALDLNGLTRIDRYSRRVDMGCYEYLHQGALYRLK